MNNKQIEPDRDSLLHHATEFAKAQEWKNVQYSAELEGIRVPLSGQNGTYTVLVRAYNDMSILSSTTYSPFNVPASRRKEIAELLCRLNWNSIAGCMEMNFSSGELTCRTEVDFEGGTPTQTMIGNLIHVSFMRMDTAFPMIMEVIYGNRTAAEFFENDA